MKRHSSAEDAKASIIASLGGHESEYDVDAIFGRVFRYKVDRDDAGNELASTAGFEMAVSQEKYWEMVLECKLHLECQHAWIAGMMYVHEEDLESVAKMRAASGSSLPECEWCELVYVPEDQRS